MAERILVVEDNEDNLKIICRLLQDEDYEVTAVRSGGEVLERLQSESFDVILLEQRLPVRRRLLRYQAVHQEAAPLRHSSRSRQRGAD
jgi:CheY-like chemotaxis protein